MRSTENSNSIKDDCKKKYFRLIGSKVEVENIAGAAKSFELLINRR